MGPGGLADGQVAHARLHPGAKIVGIDLQDALHARQAQNQPVGQRLGAAGQAGARSPGDDGQPVPVTETDNGLNLFLRFRQGHGQGQSPPGREAVAFIHAQHFRLQNKTVRRQDVREGVA